MSVSPTTKKLYIESPFGAFISVDLPKYSSTIGGEVLTETNNLIIEKTSNCFEMYATDWSAEDLEKEGFQCIQDITCFKKEIEEEVIPKWSHHSLAFYQGTVKEVAEQVSGRVLINRDPTGPSIQTILVTTLSILGFLAFSKKCLS